MATGSNLVHDVCNIASHRMKMSGEHSTGVYKTLNVAWKMARQTGVFVAAVSIKFSD